MYRVESLLAARLFVSPQVHGDLVTCISDMSGRLSLYAMEARGSVPVPLLPPHVALHNPKLTGGYSYAVFPDLDRIVVMLDADGDERFQPCWIPLDGGFPEPCLAESERSYRYHLRCYDEAAHRLYFVRDHEKEPIEEAVRLDLETGELEVLCTGRWGCSPEAFSSTHHRVVLLDEYTIGDRVLYLWEQGRSGRRLLAGTPRDQRGPGRPAVVSGFSSPQFSADDRILLFISALFDDAFGMGCLDLENPDQVEPVAVLGLRHRGRGELVHVKALGADHYALEYNIDGCSWLYRTRFDVRARTLTVLDVLCGEAPLAEGTMQDMHHDHGTGRVVMSFSSATSPSQLVLADPAGGLRPLTRERVLGVPRSRRAPGEDASFRSFDGERISARLYLPSEQGSGPFPLVYYIHGGPQTQERPDFTWFSMPLIQFLTLNGFAVFVPNVRGSTGYGLRYTRLVDNDWGGADRLDHVAAMEHLADDPRIDTSRAGVMGRSYGGYMTLTLAVHHPEWWSAAVDMFGVYDLLGFAQRIPVTWQPYFREAVGDPDTEEGRRFLIERSPRRYLDRLACPLLVVQGANDPRVVEQESRDLVEALRRAGKDVSYLLFPDEGHDVLKFANRVRCYDAINEFFLRHLG